jgi:glyoxylase-like metal-dependent hydrolase (beta-lactamase superfamily II)
LYDEENKILISGDTIFIDGFGRTDLEGGDKRAMQKSLQKLKSLEIQTFLPGHGTPATKDNKYTRGKIKQILSKI